VPLLEQVLEKNPTTVKIAVLNYPLRSHRFAINAAIAALAAARQGKFWEFHDELFKIYRDINDEKIKQIAQKLGLDETQFEKDRNDPLILKKIQQDIQQAHKLGVSSVPTVFINGKQARSRSLSDFQRTIDQELMKLKAKQ
jgi:predicted DsbA family dithiol-disulfide isomerase